jgi:YHS domain-containing protein
MLSKSVIVLLACCGLMLTSGVDDLTGIKCVVQGDKNASKEFSAKFQDGEVYFCCNNCKKKFEADPSAYEVKANHQLVLTGQYTQKACPFSGNPVNEEMKTEVGGVEVGFCCEGCLKKVADAEDVAAKATLVFSEKPFAKGFARNQPEYDLTGVKCPVMSKRDVSGEFSVDYRDGKLFFCCKNCPKSFAKDSSKYAAHANQQLVLTGQYAQKACPISGEAVDDDQKSVVNGTEVKFCCENCKQKVDGAADDAARAEMVFGDKPFEQGFAKK